MSRRRGLRSHALEYLDNTLGGDIRSTVFTVIDDTPLAEKIENAARRFDLERRSQIEVLRENLDCRRPDDESSVGVTLAAIYKIYSAGVEPLFPELRKIEQVGVCENVRETAAWVRQRL